jgi:hypothetical protein
MEIKAVGAFAFGLIIGWYVYYVNRYRKGDVQFSDITTLIGVIGGGAVLSLFNTPDLFGWYGIGLAVGFFGYFLVLVGLVKKSENFSTDWFLDGRRKNPGSDYGYGQDAASTVPSDARFSCPARHAGEWWHDTKLLRRHRLAQPSFTAGCEGDFRDHRGRQDQGFVRTPAACERCRLLRFREGGLQ